MFVTPELNGWTVVAGGWCDPSDDDRGEDVRLLVEKVSKQYGEAHAYCISEYSEYSAWLIAKDGRTVRRYSEETPALAIGLPLPVERRHLDALGVSVSPEEMHTKVESDPAMDEAFCEFSYACNARTVAAELSIDIVGGVRRSISVVRGTGMLARRSDASGFSILPGAYQI